MDPESLQIGDSRKLFNPIVVGLFDSTILVGGGKKTPPT